MAKDSAMTFATATAANLDATVSGRYEGENTGEQQGKYFLDLRVDVDSVNGAPTMDRVSGDLYQVSKTNIPGTLLSRARHIPGRGSSTSLW